MRKAKTKAKQNAGNAKPSAVKPSKSEDKILADYSFLDWRNAERGKYAKRYAEGTNIMLIASRAAQEDE